MAKSRLKRTVGRERCRSPRSRSIAALIVAAGGWGAGPAVGQGLPLEVGVGVSRNGSPPPELSETGCAADIGWAAEGRVALPLSRALRIEALGAYHFESGVSCVQPATIPPTGPFELTERSGLDGGFPYLSTDARISIEPTSPAGSVWIRAFGGYGRMWSVGEGYWLAGGGLVFGGQITTVVELEWNWFDLAYEDTVRMYQDGILTSTGSIDGSTSYTELRIRAGFRLRL